MFRLSQSRSKTGPPPDESMPRLRSPQPPAHADPCCTACPSHPPDSVAEMESAFASLENPLRLAFWGMCSRVPGGFEAAAGPSVADTAAEPRLHPRDKSPEE